MSVLRALDAEPSRLRFRAAKALGGRLRRIKERVFWALAGDFPAEPQLPPRVRLTRVSGVPLTPLRE